MIDTNGHSQDIVGPAQRFIEVAETGWDLTVSPVKDHGFVRPSSRADNYRRIIELFESTMTWPRANGGAR